MFAYYIFMNFLNNIIFFKKLQKSYFFFAKFKKLCYYFFVKNFKHMHIEYITLVISAIAIIFSGFSLMYTRKIAILNQSEQERNDHVELNITIANLYESQVCFENISLRRILYLQSIEYNGLEQNL